MKKAFLLFFMLNICLSQNYFAMERDDVNLVEEQESVYLPWKDFEFQLNMYSSWINEDPADDKVKRELFYYSIFNYKTSIDDKVKRECFKRLLSNHNIMHHLYNEKKMKLVELSDPMGINGIDINPIPYLIKAMTFDSRLFTTLIKNGANINRVYDANKDPFIDHSKTALRVAVYHGNLKAAKILLENGADPNLKSPIINAISEHCSDAYDNFPMVKLLLSHGANPNLKTQTFFSQVPLAASIYEVKDLARSLKLACEHHKNNSSYFAWLKKRYMTQIVIIRLLLQYGADPFLKIRENQSEYEHWKFTNAYEYAQEVEIDEIVKIFDEHKAA